MRTLTLTNASNQTYSLNVPGTAFLVNPGGLGIDMDSDYTRVGDSYVRNYYRYAQSVISGTIVFGGYSEYQNFISFIVAGGLVLKYRPAAGLSEYSRDVDFASITKSELGTGGVLECEVQLNCKGLWYIKVSETGYGTVYSPGHVSTMGSWFETINDGQVASDWKLTINIGDYGTVAKGLRVGWGPTLEGTPEVTAEFTRSSNADESFVWDSRDGQIECVADGTNMVNLLTLSSNNFFKISRNGYFVYYMLDVTTTQTTTYEATFELYKRYISV